MQILEYLDLGSMSVQMVLMACAPQQLSTHEGLVSMLLEMLCLQAACPTDKLSRVLVLQRSTSIHLLKISPW